MAIAILRNILFASLIVGNMGCGFSPLHHRTDSMEKLKNISIQTEKTYTAFLIKEALEGKAPFSDKSQNILQVKPTIKNSYGVITKENEITRYSVTLNVEYSLYNAKTNKLILNNIVSSTSDYSAAITYTGFATEIARKDTYERLADAVAEKMITEIIIHLSNGYTR